MSDANRLLEIIERDIVAHGGDLGGWTRLSDESLQLFDGRVTLRAEVHEEEQAGDNVVHGTSSPRCMSTKMRCSMRA